LLLYFFETIGSVLQRAKIKRNIRNGDDNSKQGFIVVVVVKNSNDYVGSIKKKEYV